MVNCDWCCSRNREKAAHNRVYRHYFIMNKQKRKNTSEKPDCSVNSKADRDAIYEIYRACRLCGAGAGYKMPIVQNIVNVDDTEVELKSKIRECVQIEVHQNDKMPPLICELCVDKVNDFYEFLEMCRQTNKRTRIRLGLPPQVLTKEEDEGDCILGITEPVFVKAESASNQKNKGNSTKAKDNGKGKSKVQEKIKKEVTIKTEKPSRANRELRELLGSIPQPSRKKPPTPLRPRNSRSKDDEEKVPKEAKAPPSNSKLKRTREKEPQTKQEVNTKKVKFAETPPPRSTRTSSVKSEPVVEFNSVGDEMKTCKECGVKFPKGRSFNIHMRCHAGPKKNPAEIECLKCSRKFLLGVFENHKCKKDEEPKPKPKFAGKCKKCDKPFEVYKTLMKHQSSCKKGKIQIAAFVHKRLRPLHVRMMRCDSLLQKEIDGHYDVSGVRCPFGLDKSCVYPYKREQSHSILNYDRMVHIKFDEIKDNLDINDDLVHWDSDNSSDADVPISELTKPESLSNLALKTIFSDKLLGKIPKKRKKIKSFDNDFRLNINNIISNLDEDDIKSSKGVFDNLKDNWSDNVSDSILKNGYDSDRTSFNEDFNDDTNQSDNKTSNNDKLISSNDNLGKVNNLVLEESTNNLVSSEDIQKTIDANENSENQKEISEISNNSKSSCKSNDQSHKHSDRSQRNSGHSCSKPKCKKSSNNENILEITKEITEMRINDGGDVEAETCKKEDESDQVNSDENIESSNHLSLVSQAGNDENKHTKDNINTGVDLRQENIENSSENTLNCTENHEIIDKNEKTDTIASNNNVNTTNKNDEEINNKREKFSRMNSEIKVLDIQIISENDENSSDVCVNKDESPLSIINHEQSDSKSKNDQNSDRLKISEANTILNSKTHDETLNIDKTSECCSGLKMGIESINDLQTSSKNKEAINDTKVDIESKNDNNIDDENSVNCYEDLLNDLDNIDVNYESVDKNDTPIIETKSNSTNNTVSVEDNIDENKTKLDDENNKTTNGDEEIDLNDLEDISDDDRLMNEINAQIGDSAKVDILNDLLPNKSTDLDSISDGEFTFDD